VLFKDTYRGVVTWNKSRKRNRWGAHQQHARPTTEWLEIQAPELRIVSDDLWRAAHSRLTAARAIYFRTTAGRTAGRPPLGNPSRYLLTNLAICGCCGGPMKARSRKHGTGKGRKHFYGCAWYHERGTAVCSNGADVPMTDADEIVIEALLDDVMDDTIVADAVTEAIAIIHADPVNRIPAIEAELAAVDQERSRLVAAIASGGALDGLVQALRARELRRTD
jgi:site-specific DNA recombinase